MLASSEVDCVSLLACWPQVRLIVFTDGVITSMLTSSEVDCR